MARYRSPRQRIASLIIAITLAITPYIAGACGDRTDAATTWDGALRDSAGVVLVENYGTPMWREGDAWTFTKRVRVGVAQGDSAYMIGGLSGLVLLSDGRVVIGDALFHNVRFFSPEGVYLATVGREGAGPGEFGGRIDLMLGAGDTLLAVDWGNRQASTITPDGTWLGSFSILPSDGFRIFSWDDDEATDQIVSHHRPLLGDAAPDDPRFELLIERAFSGEHLDTLALLPANRSVTVRGDAVLVHFYRPESHYDLCDGMIVTGFSDEFRITWNRPDGTVERIATLEREPLPLTSEDEAAFLRMLDEQAREFNVPPQRTADYKARLRFTSTYPAYRRFVCGPAGTLLVQRVKPLRELSDDELRNQGTSQRAPASEVWDVFDREGRYLGVAPLPVPPHRHAFTQDTSGTWLMSGLERGELNVPYAAVWEIAGIER